MSPSHVLSMFSFCVIFAGVACGETDEGSPAAAASTNEDGGGAASDAGPSTTDGAVKADGATVTKDASVEASTTTTCGPSTKEGDPCGTPGAFCHPSACNDPCQFCNVLSCTNGKWDNMEAFPLPQTECAATFACGSLTCQHGQYCLVRYAGVALQDGGSAPPDYACTDLPSNCKGGCGCADQAAQTISSCQAQTCKATGGGPVVPCYGI